MEQITIILTADQVKARLIELLANQVTPKFISVRNYRNNQNEVSNYVINIGVDYGTAKESDTKMLKDPSNFENLKGYSNEARIALLEANLKPSHQSKVQSELYTQICPNIRMHDKTGRLYVNGFKISKSVLEEVEYPEVNSSALTIAKNIIRKELKATKFRQFCFDKLVEIRMNGETLEFDF